MMESSFTLQHIKTRATPNSFSRGQSYYYAEVISNTIQRGDQIEARCQGTMEYVVRARLTTASIAETSCTCEYSGAGDCKHIVALLLAYLDDPSQFIQRPTLSETLASFNPNDFIALLEYLVDQEPHLHEIIDEFKTLNTPEASSRELFIRQKINRSFNQLISSYNNYEMDYSQIRSLIHSAENGIEQDQWVQATQIYCGILEAFPNGMQFTLKVLKIYSI